MGKWFSKSHDSETNNEDNQNVNNIIIEDTVTVHNDTIIILLYIITVLLILKFVLHGIQINQRFLKKKYQSRFELQRV